MDGIGEQTQALGSRVGLGYQRTSRLEDFARDGAAGRVVIHHQHATPFQGSVNHGLIGDAGRLGYS